MIDPLLLLLISDILWLLLLHRMLNLLDVRLALMLDVLLCCLLLLKVRLSLRLLWLLLVRNSPVLSNLLNLHRFGSGHGLRWLLEGIIHHEVRVFLCQDPLNNLVSHPVVSHQSLARILCDIITALEGTLVRLVGDQGDVFEELLLQVFITHVLPEGIPGRELHLTVSEGTLDHGLTVVLTAGRAAPLVPSLGRSAGRHLRLRDVAAHYLSTDGFLHLLVSHSVVADHGRHLLVLVRTERALVGRVARRWQELGQVRLVVSLGQVTVEITGLASLHGIAVNTEDPEGSFAAGSRGLDVLVTGGNIFRHFLRSHRPSLAGSAGCGLRLLAAHKFSRLN